MDVYYKINEDRQIELCSDVFEWSEWMQTADRTVAKQVRDDVMVSTVFLGLDHSFTLDEHVPILFETMVFGGEHDQYQERCCTWMEAETMHKRVCRIVWPWQTERR